MADRTELYRLDGKVAVVTGGSRSLGREMVLAFAEVGADVVIASRTLDTCEALAEQVRETTGRRALAVACDVERWTDCDALYEQAYAGFDRVDILVNNAGGPLRGLSPDPRDITEELWHKSLNLNVSGAFRLSALFGGRMRDDGGGVVLNIGSVGGLRTGGGNMPYGAGKAALHAITTGFAQAYGPTVRVNAIAAGAFVTDLSRGGDLPRVEEMARERFSLARVGAAEEIVGSALYLVSDASSYTTGAIVRVDGGWPV